MNILSNVILKGNNASGLYGGLGGGSNINNENVNRSILSDILWFDKEFNFSGGDGGDGGIVTNEFGQNGKRGFWGSGGKKRNSYNISKCRFRCRQWRWSVI